MSKKKDSNLQTIEQSTCDTQTLCTEVGKNPELNPRNEDIVVDSQKSISLEEVEASEHKQVLPTITPSRRSKRLEERKGGEGRGNTTNLLKLRAQLRDARLFLLI